MRYKKLGLIQQTSQKKRYNDGCKKIKLSFGTIGVCTFKTCRFEYAYLNLVRRFLKAMLKMKYARVNIAKIWIFLRFNYPIRRKSKNARMGKGVGAFLRWSTRLRRGYTLVEFRGISLLRVNKLCKVWQKHLSFPLVLKTFNN